MRARASGRSSFAVLDVSPRYVDAVGGPTLSRMREVIPDAQLVFLARPGAEIFFSGLDMAAASSATCDVYGKYERAFAAGGCPGARQGSERVRQSQR